jgi:hypothetical protein
LFVVNPGIRTKMRDAAVIADLYLRAQGQRKGVTKSGIRRADYLLTAARRHPPKV